MFGSKSNASTTTRYQMLNIQTSTQGGVIPIHYGQNRVAPNIIWYDGFRSVAVKQSSGKGGGGGKGSSEYKYYTDIIMALCEGVVSQCFGVYDGSSSFEPLSYYDMALFGGEVGQAGWSYLQDKYPSQYLPYSGTAYVAVASLSLGTSPDLPGYSFEIAGNLWSTVLNNVDANPADIALDYVTNAQYGLAPGATWIDATSLEQFRQYCGAQGIYFSPYMNEQEQVTNTFQRWSQITNTFIFWSGNVLKFCPLGAYPLSLNGYTYTPQITPVYDLTYDDFVPEGKGKEPVTVNRTDPADGYNHIQFDIRDRDNNYNITSMYWSDPASVSQYGELPSNIVEAQEICLQSIANIGMALLGQRSVYVRNTYTFKLGYQYCLLEPGDIVTLTELNIGLDQFPVRIQSVQEGDDQLLTITAEEFPASVGVIASQAREPAAPSPTYNPNVDPGSVNPPAIFEPSPTLTNGAAEVWIGLSGGEWWGGASIYLSFDSDVYSNIGLYASPMVQGELAAALPAHADPDTTDTLVVDLTISRTSLPSTATSANADALQTLVLVDQELMAYGTVALGSGSEIYDLTYLRRGAYGTAITNHAVGFSTELASAVTNGVFALPLTEATGLVVGQFTSGSSVGIPPGARIVAISGSTVTLDQATTEDLPAGSLLAFLPSIFTRIDQSAVFAYTLPAQYVGQKLYFKFVSFNSFGGAAQDISEVAEYVYTPSGVAFFVAAPGVPTLSPSSVTQSDGTTLLTMTAAWAPSAGPLVGSYIVEFSTNGGTTWSGGTTLPASTTSYGLTPALAETEYLVRVAAVSQSGQATSAWATIAAPVDSGSLVSTVPDAPTSLVATAAPGGVLLTFTLSDSLSTQSYQSWHAPSGTSFSGASQGPSAVGSGIAILNLTAGAEYTFWVTAVNSAGPSTPSSPASAIPNNAGTNGILFEGVSYSTVQQGTNVTITPSGETLTWSASTASGVLYEDVLYVNLAPGSGTTFTGSGSTLTIGGMVGPEGPPGTNGTNGTNGTDGTAIDSGSGPPSSSVGANGDFYINTTTYVLYGPKEGGAWPTPGTPLVGADGEPGAPGATGPAGGGGLAFSVVGTVPVGQIVFWYPFSAENTLAAGLPGAAASCAVAPTGAVTMPIRKNGVTIGSINFAAETSTATFTFDDAVTFQVGDVLTVWGPTATDATFSTVGANLASSYVGTSSTANELAWYAATGTIIVGNANVTYSAGALTIGVAGVTGGSLVLSGETSGVVTVKTNAATGSWSMTLPTTAGISGQVLTTDGSGNTSWATASGGSGGGVTALTSGGVAAVGSIAITGAGATLLSSAALLSVVQFKAGYASSGTLDIVLDDVPTVGNLLVLTGTARYTGPDPSIWTISLSSPQSYSITNYVAYRVVQPGDTNTWAFGYGAGYNITEISGSSSLVVTGAALTESISGNAVSATVAADTVGTLDIITFCDASTPFFDYLPAGATPLGSWTSSAYVASGAVVAATNNGVPYTAGYTASASPNVNSTFYARVAPATGGVSYALNVPGGVTDFVQGTLTATGEITIGSGLTLTGNTLSGSGGLLGPVTTALGLGTALDYGLITDTAPIDDDFGLVGDPNQVPIELGATLT
jgi:hypothetical protein